MAYEQEHPLIKGTSNDTTAATPDRLGSGWLTASLASSTDVDYFKIDTTSAALIKIDLSNLLVTDTKHWSLALLDGKSEEDVFGPDDAPAPPTDGTLEGAGEVERDLPRPTTQPGLAGGALEARGLDLPEKPEPA